MSLAVAKAIVQCNGDYSALSKNAVKYMQEIGRPYPFCGYGGMFRQWMYSDDPKPYGSYGNGAAMRVSACGFAATSIDEAIELSRKVTEVTHNHPEGIKGAEATAVAIYMERSIKFYRDGLGYKTDCRENNPPVCFFDTPGTKFELFPLE